MSLCRLLEILERYDTWKSSCRFNRKRPTSFSFSNRGYIRPVLPDLAIWSNSSSVNSTTTKDNPERRIFTDRTRPEQFKHRVTDWLISTGLEVKHDLIWRNRKTWWRCIRPWLLSSRLATGRVNYEKFDVHTLLCGVNRSSSQSREPMNPWTFHWMLVALPPIKYEKSNTKRSIFHTSGEGSSGISAKVSALRFFAPRTWLVIHHVSDIAGEEMGNWWRI